MSTRPGRRRVGWPDTAPEHGFRGIYINLDRAQDRRAWMESQIASLGLDNAFVRVPGVDGKTVKPQRRARIRPAELGGFEAHLAAARLAAETDLPVNVVEDDTRLTEHLAPFVTHADATGLLDRYDVMFTDMWINGNVFVLKPYEESHRVWRASQRRVPEDVVLMEGFAVGCSSSYIVGREGAGKLVSLLSTEMGRGPRLQVDAFIDRCVRSGALRAAVTVPFLSIADEQYAVHSDIQNVSKGEYRHFVGLRQLFFVDHDGARDTLPWVTPLLQKAVLDGGDPDYINYLRYVRDLAVEHDNDVRPDRD